MAHSQHWRGGWAGAIVALACGLWGCSVHPLPDDVAKASTVDIVERIRCEVQEGLLRFASTDAHARKIIEGTTIGLEFDFVMHEVNSTTAGSLEFERPAGGGGGTKFELEVNAAASSKRENKRVLQDMTPVIGVRLLADSSVNIAVKPWVGVQDYGPAGGEINKSILEAFREHGIVIPYPQREVRLLQDAA